MQDRAIEPRELSDMNDALFRLIYVSQNNIEGDVDTVQAEIDQILSVARDANRLCGVTGALMFNSGCFAQILEGDQADVEATFERIQCDYRHSDVVILSYSSIDSRSFNDWSMAYIGQCSESNEAFEHIRSESNFDSSRLNGDHVFEMMKSHLAKAESNNRNAA